MYNLSVEEITNPCEAACEQQVLTRGLHFPRRYTFDAAVIASVAPRFAPRGSTVTVLGTGLGNYDASPTIILGDTACESAR